MWVCFAKKMAHGQDIRNRFLICQVSRQLTGTSARVLSHVVEAASTKEAAELVGGSAVAD